MSNIDTKEIKRLLKQGKSGSAIAKQLHIRKQKVLTVIRRIKNVPIQKEKITNKKGQLSGKKRISKAIQENIQNAYENGWSFKDLKKIFAIYKISDYKLQKLINSFLPISKEMHKSNNKCRNQNLKHASKVKYQKYWDGSENTQKDWYNIFKKQSLTGAMKKYTNLPHKKGWDKWLRDLRGSYNKYLSVDIEGSKPCIRGQ